MGSGESRGQVPHIVTCVQPLFVGQMGTDFLCFSPFTCHMSVQAAGHSSSRQHCCGEDGHANFFLGKSQGFEAQL